MGNIEDDLRKRVRNLRQKAGLSQVALATHARLSVQTIKDIEAGRRGAGLRAMQSIAGALGITIEELAGEREPEIEPREPELLDIKKALKLFDSVPPEVYHLAQELKGDEEAWETIVATMKGLIKIKHNHANQNNSKQA